MYNLEVGKLKSNKYLYNTHPIGVWIQSDFLTQSRSFPVLQRVHQSMMWPPESRRVISFHGLNSRLARPHMVVRAQIFRCLFYKKKEGLIYKFNDRRGHGRVNIVTWWNNSDTNLSPTNRFGSSRPDQFLRNTIDPNHYYPTPDLHSTSICRQPYIVTCKRNSIFLYGESPVSAYISAIFLALWYT